jgi:hypothetical protein
MQFRYIALIAVSTLALAACDDDEITAPNDTASVRFVNASSTNATANGTVAGTAMASNIAFQGGSGACVNVPTGTQTVGFTNSTGTAIGGGSSFNFVGGQRYTVVLYGNGNTQVFQDEFNTPTSGNNGIRFINATSTAGDVFGTTATGTVSGTPTLANLGAYSSTGTSGTTAFGSYANTNTRYRLYNVGTTATARGDFTLGTMPSNNVTTVVFTPTATSGTTTGFMVNPCP